MLLSAAAPVLADQDAWIKKRKPEELFAFVMADPDCPVSEADAREIVHGALVRARIRELSEWTPRETMLVLQLDCLKERDARWVFSVEAKLAKMQVRQKTELVTTPMFGTHRRMGRSGADGIRQAVRDTAEAALTDYLEANFDLDTTGTGNQDRG